MTEWRPISTLPKSKEYYVFLAYFGTAKKMFGSRKMALAYAADENNKDFKDPIEEGYFFHKPTHWMPLPNPPEPKDEETSK